MTITYIKRRVEFSPDGATFQLWDKKEMITDIDEYKYHAAIAAINRHLDKDEFILNIRFHYDSVWDVDAFQEGETIE